jgi:Tfp pilus assembly protein PilP
MTTKTGLALMLLLAVPLAVHGQAPPAPAVPATSAAAVKPGPSQGFVYAIEGRRDPFQNQIGTGTEPQPVQRGEGAAGLTLSEISVRGIMQSRGALIAMIQGANNRTYVIHSGDKLADGVVKAVTPQGLIVLQDIHDPLSNQKQREVRKLLRSLEEARE